MSAGIEIPTTTTLVLSLLISVLTGSTSDFWVFAAGLVAGVVIVVAIRRDLPHSERRRWNGEERRHVE